MEYLIKDIAYIIASAMDFKGKIVFNTNKPDGQYRKDVCINKFKSYFPNFQFTSLSDGIKEVYAAVFRNI
jgi:GDP-L-fucose synthase